MDNGVSKEQVKANELRIGNWVIIPSESIIGVVSDIGSDESLLVEDEKTRDSYMVNTSNISPIPLTPEILEKAGFVKSDNKWQIADSDGELLEFVGIDPNGVLQPDMYYTGANISQKAKPKYLHTLQNLYFALTGEELEINLT